MLIYYCNDCGEEFESEEPVDAQCPYCNSDNTEVVD